MARNYIGGRAAFPFHGGVSQDGDSMYPQEGMTLRQYFAGQALIAMGQWTPLDGMVRSEITEALMSVDFPERTHRMRAAFAVAAADALIAELKK